MKKNNVQEEKHFIENNKKGIVGLVVGIIIGVIGLSIFWPERIAKLENGEEAIMSIKNHTFTANDLYEFLKSKSGNEAIEEMLDETILKDKYPDSAEDAQAYAKEQSSTIYSSYQNYYGTSKEQFLSGNGFANEQEFLDELAKNYYKKKYFDEYVAAKITEKEINKFYKESVFGEKVVYIFSASEEKNDLDKVKNELKNKKTFNEIKEKYSNVNSQSYESVKYDESTTFSQTILNQIAKTKANSTSETFKDQSLGYVTLYVVSEKDKPALEDEKTHIIDLLVANKQNEDNSLYYEAFIDLRKEYELNFYDTKIKETYDEAVKQYKSAK